MFTDAGKRIAGRTDGRGGDCQQKSPSGEDGLKERVMGLEPSGKPAVSEGNRQVSEPGAAKGAVALCPPVFADADLQAIAEAWPSLPAAIRAGIVAMVKAAMSDGESGKAQ